MPELHPIVSTFQRYADLIRPMLGGTAPFEPATESATAIQVERGVVYPQALLHPHEFDGAAVDRVIELSVSPRMATIAVIDRQGHHRPVYRGLLIYSWLRAFSLVYETLSRKEFGQWEEGLRPWCDLLEGELGEIDLRTAPISAQRGSNATEAAWIALALHVAGKVFIRDAWTDLASDAFGKLTRAQTETGAFLFATGSDNPETFWYHELVLLHAAASYAVQAEDRTVAAAVRKSAEFHVKETQPDHATNQPFGLFAFLWHEPARSLADQLLHAASIERSEITLMLLADALYCLELFTKKA